MVAESPGQPGNIVDESSLKRRMLGAAVLIALAVIFLPLVFDGSGTESQFRSIQPLQMEPPFDAVILEEKTMSLADGTPVIDFVEDDQLTVSETQEVALQARQAEPPRPVAAVAEPVTIRTVPQKTSTKQPSAITKPATVPTVEPVAVVKPVPAPKPVSVVDNANWLIQIASFKDKINALSLRSELKGEGHPVVVKVGDIAGDAIFRVYVGPVSGKDNASQVKSSLEKSLNRETLLVEDK